jgi:benzoyl-CoA reductase/2-hydroxyglutaryl-CoA dehydratase subunit BcrC/BadD/HgdB
MSISDMKRSIKHLETTKKMKEMLPRFFMRMYERKSGKEPLAWCMVGVPPELLKAFDLLWEWPENFGTLCAARLVAPRFIEVAESDGYSQELCSYVTNTMGYCKLFKEKGEAPLESPLPGGMGNPTMLLGSGFICEPRWKWFQSIATRFIDVPVFSSDPLAPPWDVDPTDPRIEAHYKELLRDDLDGQVHFLEKHTGKKLDPDLLREVMRKSTEALSYWRDTLALRKAVPTPMGATDYFQAIIPQMYMVGEDEAVTFYREMYHEVKDRVERGIGIVKEEKYRLIWFGLPPWYNMGVFNYLESLGAVFAYESTYNVGDSFEVDLDDPLEALVQRAWQRVLRAHRYGTEAMPELCNFAVFGGFAGSGLLKEVVQDFSLNGAVMHLTRSCRAVSFGQVHTRNRLAEIGIPSLIFESDMADPRLWSDAQIKTRLHAFLETVDKIKKDLNS